MKQVQRLLFVFLLFATVAANAQVGIGTTTPDASAQLDVSSTTKGFLPPRMDSSQRVAIASPATGLLVYQTNGTDGFYFYNGASWIYLSTTKTVFDTLGGVVLPGNAVNVATDNFVFGSSQLDNDGNTDHYSRFFFNKAKSAFRTGLANDGSWDTDSLGDVSFASGLNARATRPYTTAIGHSSRASNNYATAIGPSSNASGYSSTAIGVGPVASGSFATANGYFTTAGGDYATAMGYTTTAPSAYETTAGSFNTGYTPNSTQAWNPADRLFTIGNGTAPDNLSDALVILKNGNTGLGTSTPDTTLHVVGKIKYQDGTQASGKVLTSDANGNASWQPSGLPSGTTPGQMMYWNGSSWITVAASNKYGATLQLWGGVPSWTGGVAIGDTLQGGIVGYIFQPGDTGYVAGEIHGIIAAFEDLPGPSTWDCNMVDIPGADGTAVGTGYQNTLDIVAAGCGYAGQFYSLNGYNDWFLPSLGDLQQLYINRAAIGNNFVQWISYWSSTEINDTDAWRYDMYWGRDVQSSKLSQGYVRPVRYF